MFLRAWSGDVVGLGYVIGPIPSANRSALPGVGNNVGDTLAAIFPGDKEHAVGSNARAVTPAHHPEPVPGPDEVEINIGPFLGFAINLFAFAPVIVARFLEHRVDVVVAGTFDGSSLFDHA